MTTFLDATLPEDTIPEVSDIEYPCIVCGKEAGPYGKRGPKPKYCDDHKTNKRKGSTGRVTGSAASLAAQATETLSQLNAMIAVGAMAVQMFQTAKALQEGDEQFRAQAFAALVTDPELCKFILKGGVMSAKLTLALAYGGLGMTVAPTAIMELKDKKERRLAKKALEDMDNATGA